MDWIMNNWVLVGAAAGAVGVAAVAVAKITKNKTDDAVAAKFMAVVKKIFGK